MSPGAGRKGGLRHAPSTGKLYFDVTGPIPNSVAYNDGVTDLMLWVGSGGGGPAPAIPVAPMAPGY